MRYENYDVDDRIKMFIGLARRSKHMKPSQEDLHEARDILRSTGQLDHLSDDDLKHLAGHARKFSYPAHWTVQAEGTVPDVCLLIVEGTASLRRRGETVGTASTGAMLGVEDALAHRTAHESVVSDTRLTGIAVEADVLVDMLNRPATRRPAKAPAFGGVTVPAFNLRG